MERLPATTHQKKIKRERGEEFHPGVEREMLPMIRASIGRWFPNSYKVQGDVCQLLTVLEKLLDI